MPEIIEIQTERLIMRQWRRSDFSEFAKINSDPDVMEFYPSILTAKESNEMAERIESKILVNGWGFWAIEIIDKKSFIGFVGLNEPRYELPVSPCIEIGWRLAKEFWGNGYATEAGKAALDIAFNTLELTEVHSFASLGNSKSIAVMERLNMTDIHKNFNHPMMPLESPLREHVLYKIDREVWLKVGPS